ncbi:MAG TPA: hypothetical protein VGN18_01465 [Jatrophihabitans sp.]|jgi:hypothetical protein|uniref:hypothetical protein n=1 Tax=Jatrophihabitans sp. TaxID=1932789 RepID=UPI002E0BD15E|nr:hypothetical protein [Jatrophihabitans sp.]
MRGLARLYPPSWRERYGAELDALLDDTPPSTRQTLDVIAGAARAWLHPARQLHSPGARMRTTIGVALYAWVTLAAGVAVFVQFTEDPGFGAVDAAHAGAGAAHGVFRVAAAASLGLVTLGLLPLAGSLLLTARRQHRSDVLRRLLSPVVAIAAFGLVLVLVVTLAPRSRVPGEGIGNWFLLLLAAGLVAGFGCAHGPAVAVRRLAVGAAPTRVAVVALAGAIVALAVATVGAALYSAELHTWMPGAGVSRPAFAVPFVALMALPAAIAAISLSRGLRAARSATLEG